AHWRWCPGTPSWKTVVVSRQVEYSSWSSVNENHMVPGREKSSDGGGYQAPPSLIGATLQAMERIGSAMSKCTPSKRDRMESAFSCIHASNASRLPPSRAGARSGAFPP